MTYILGCNCIDGVVLIADKKISYQDRTSKFQKKLFVFQNKFVVGASGAQAAIDRFKVYCGEYVSKNAVINDLTRFVATMEDIVIKVNKELDSKLLVQDCDLLLGIKDSNSPILIYVPPRGASENISNHHAIGIGEPYGSVLISLFWNEKMKMIECAELGYRIIKYIENLRLHDSVGVGNDYAQIVFIPNEYEIKEASERVLIRMDETSIDWLDKMNLWLRSSYQSMHTHGQYVTINSWGTKGLKDGQFEYPEGIAINSSGNVYVAAEHNHCIQVFDSKGKFLFKWGVYGKENGHFDVPYGIAIDSSDHVYVTESGNERIQKFDKNGIYVPWGTKETQSLKSPHGIAIDKNGEIIYVSEETSNCIKKFDKEGNLLQKWGHYYDTNVTPSHNANPSDKTIGDGHFNHPSGVATDFLGNMYVADQLNHRIQKFDRNGNFLCKWGTYGSKEGDFNRPHGIAFERDNEIFVCDSLNFRVQKFSPDGKFISQWGEKGDQEGSFDYPRSIVSNNGIIYVTESTNNRVQVFASALATIRPVDYEDQWRL